MFVYKRSSFFFIKQNDKPSGEERFFNIKAILHETSFGQKFIIYLDPVNFNSCQ